MKKTSTSRSSSTKSVYALYLEGVDLIERITRNLAIASRMVEKIREEFRNSVVWKE